MKQPQLTDRPRLGRGWHTWRSGEEAAAIRSLRHEKVQLVAIPRTLPPALHAPLSRWARDSRGEFDQIVSAECFDVAPALGDLPDGPRSWLAADIERLIGLLAHLSGSEFVRVSFGAVRSDRCRRFHTDVLRYRLITTYSGPGTEWLGENAVDRHSLMQVAASRHDVCPQVLPNLAGVRRARAGEMLVMKGELHEHGGVVHRSPPIESTGQVRVVLIVSTVEET